MDEEILRRARRITGDIRLCNHCLGRLFLEVEGKDNEERGRKIRQALGGEEPERCELCGGFFKRIDETAWKAVEMLNRYDVRTIIVSSSVPKSVLQQEEEIWERYEIKQSESIKKDISRTLGKKLTEIGPWRYDPESPEARIVVDLAGNVQVDILPIYITGILLTDTLPKREARRIVKTAAEAIFGAKDVRIRSRAWKDGAKIVVEIIKPVHRHVNVTILERILEEMTGKRHIQIIGTTNAEGARRFLEGKLWT